MILGEPLGEHPFNKKKIAISSGYMNPLHCGHLDYLRESKRLADYLIVIVNSDAQVKLKGSVPFMDEISRAKIVADLKCVDCVLTSIDKDRTQNQTIKLIADQFKGHEIIFCKGGDSNIENVPELKTCDELGIKVIFGVGGEKTESSSRLIEASKSKLIGENKNGK